MGSSIAGPVGRRRASKNAKDSALMLMTPGVRSAPGRRSDRRTDRKARERYSSRHPQWRAIESDRCANRTGYSDPGNPTSEWRARMDQAGNRGSANCAEVSVDWSLSMQQAFELLRPVDCSGLQQSNPIEYPLHFSSPLVRSVFDKLGLNFLTER